MKTNWNKTVNEINRKRYTIPEGWETKEEVASSLQCDPDKVADMLKPGIQTGEIERGEFPVWDDKRRLTVRVVCYRLCDGEAAPKATRSSTKGRGGSTEERILAALERNPSASNRQIAKNLYGVRSSDVEALRNL
jgi:hypothetical protein